MTVTAAAQPDRATSGHVTLNVTSSAWPEPEVDHLWLWYAVFTVVLLGLIAYRRSPIQVLTQQCTATKAGARFTYPGGMEG